VRSESGFRRSDGPACSTTFQWGTGAARNSPNIRCIYGGDGEAFLTDGPSSSRGVFLCPPSLVYRKIAGSGPVGPGPERVRTTQEESCVRGSCLPAQTDRFPIQNRPGISIFNLALMRFMKEVSHYVMSDGAPLTCNENPLWYSAYRYPKFFDSMTRRVPMSLSAIALIAFASLLPAGNGLSWIQPGTSTCARNPLRNVRPCSRMRVNPGALRLKAPDFRNPKASAQIFVWT
jgi:hypothetical protein